MKAHEIAAQFDCEPGYRIVEYGEVGVPVWALAFAAVAREVRGLDPVSEFALRCLSMGLSSEEEVAGILGLSPDVVCGAFALLFSQELVAPVGTTSKVANWRLTAAGRAAAQEEAVRATREIRRTVLVDGWTRKPAIFRESELLSPRELAAAGLPELRSFPQRPPEAAELDPQEVQQAIDLALRREEENVLVLKVVRVERANRLFVPAIALVYKPDARGDVRVEFVMNGRISPSHGAAFANNNGLEKMALFRDLLHPIAPPSNEELFGAALAAKVKAQESRDTKIKRELAVAKLKQTIARDRLEAATNQEDMVSAEAAVAEAEVKANEAVTNLAQAPVKHLLTYEHPPLLYRALETASKSVVIVSPWIRAAVVNHAFLGALKKCLEKGVDVFIGYGIGEEDKGAKPPDTAAERELESLSKVKRNLRFRRLGDTHAKILIKDDDYCIVGSFNWLSFEGNPERTFREEWSTLVSIQDVVREFKETVIARFGK